MIHINQLYEIGFENCGTERFPKIIFVFFENETQPNRMYLEAIFKDTYYTEKFRLMDFDVDIDFYSEIDSIDELKKVIQRFKDIFNPLKLQQ